MGAFRRVDFKANKKTNNEPEAIKNGFLFNLIVSLSLNN